MSETYIFLDHAPVLRELEKFQGPGFMSINPSTVTHTGLVVLILLALGLSVRLAFAGNRTMPLANPLAVPNLLEFGVRQLLSFMEGTLGAHARKFLPLVGTAFFFILFCNLMGSIPGFDSPTADYNTTLACALVVFVATHYVGFRTHGPSYIKSFLGPFWWLAWMMLPLEIISHFARIVSLSFRLFGNISGDHKVVATFLGMVPWGVPVIFMGLGIFVACVQAFVFALLTIVYISLAMEEHH
jgi:F-type H+-transporting ATPase subunit a